MEGYELLGRTGEELVRFVRALGSHRYVGSRLHLVHAFVFDAARGEGADPVLAEAFAWTAEVLADPTVDQASKDERLHRRASDAELVAVLSQFWLPGPASVASRARLINHLASIDCAPVDPGRLPFDESDEEDVFPVLVDAGWELLPLSALDPERHRGAIAAFDDFEVARFEEEDETPPATTLHELPVLGAVELALAFDDQGWTRAPFVLWQSGHPTYLDYVLRGVLRAAKLTG
jgi:hypothetical protein